MDTITLESLTSQEKAILYRRRNGLTQKEHAAEIGCHRSSIVRNKREMNIELEGLSQLEKCFLKRKRLNMTQRECARLMGITRYWFNQMELGRVAHKPLLDFWGK